MKRFYLQFTICYLPFHESLRPHIVLSLEHFPGQSKLACTQSLDSPKKQNKKNPMSFTFSKTKQQHWQWNCGKLHRTLTSEFWQLQSTKQRILMPQDPDPDLRALWTPRWPAKSSGRIKTEFGISFYDDKNLCHNNEVLTRSILLRFHRVTTS